MNWFDNINFSFSYSPIWLFLGIALILGYTIYIYRTTLPTISVLSKSLLTALRFSALFLILLLIFEPIIKISSQQKIEPTNLVFIDNSSSISKFSAPQDISNLERLVNRLETEVDGPIEFFTFGANLNEFKPELDSLKFNENTTELSSVIKHIKTTEDISSIVIISDGVINQNIIPEAELKAIPFPIFAIGIGDTAESVDLLVDQIVSNNFIYAGRDSELELIIKNIDLPSGNASVQVFDNDSLIYTKNIELSSTGVNRLRVPYFSKKEGKHKVSVKANTSKKEKNTNNNSLSKIINVLAAKKKIALIAGSPSSDLSFIANSIKKNDEFTFEQIVQISSTNFYKNNKNLETIKEADIIFLVGFPNSNTSLDFIEEVKSIITNKKVPIFFAFTPSIDFVKMKLLESVIPFKFDGISSNFSDVQVHANYTNKSLLGNSESISKGWENLPPVSLTLTNIKPVFSSQVLLSSKNNETKPMIFSNSIGSRKSIVVSASNIWRWKLKAGSVEYNYFDNFLLNSIKWLSIRSNDEFLSVSLNKSSYNLGETIPFIANLHDETFEPVDNEMITLKLLQNNEITEYNFNSIGNGLYEVNIDALNPGLLNYTVELANNSRELPSVDGTINIEPINIEFIQSNMNELFLESISTFSGGKYYQINNSQSFISDLNKVYLNKIYYKNTDKELRLSSFELILLIIVLLFSIEWIMRKIFRMI